MTYTSDREKLFRYDIVLSFLRSGDSFYGMDDHRPFWRTQHENYLGDTYDPIYFSYNGNGDQRIIEEIGTRHFPVIFNGASFDGECFVLMFRFLKEWEILKHVVRVNILEKSMNNRNISAEIIDCIGRVFRVAPQQVRGMSYDRRAPT